MSDLGADLGTLLAGWTFGFPRQCEGFGAMAFGSGGESNGMVAEEGASDGEFAGLSLALLADALGFGSMSECVAWLVSLPFEEMQFFLDLLKSGDPPCLPRSVLC